MLVYGDTKAAERRTAPPWLAGAADLCEVQSKDGSKRYWGIGNPHLVGERNDWQDLDDGWQVAIADAIDPQRFRRELRWCRTNQAEDTIGRVWSMPCILNEQGDRCILVRYGKDFLPSLTPEQSRAVEIAKAARDALTCAVDGGELDMAIAARWTAELLALSHHVSVEVIGALCFIDDSLILSALSAAVGLPLKKKEG